MEYDTRYTMDLQRKYYSSLEELHLHRNSFTEQEKKFNKRIEKQEDEIQSLKDYSETHKRMEKKQNEIIKTIRTEKSELASKVKELEKLRVKLENKYTAVDKMLAEKGQTAQEWRDEAYVNAIKNKNDLRKKLVEDNNPNSKDKDVPTNLLSRKEAAELLKISFPTLWRWTKYNTISSYRLGGKVYYKREEIMKKLKPAEITEHLAIK